jgi:TRAP transporter TAXI family solute receptor
MYYDGDMVNLMKTKLLLFLLFAGLLLSGGCSRGPAVDQLQQDLQSRIDGVFGADLFQIDSFRRYGSQPLSSEASDGREKIAVYFKTELRLLRPHHFSQWSSQNIGSLHRALGSAVRGVDGLEVSGNKTGDVLLAHGLSVYTADSSEWVAVAFKGETNSGEYLADTAGIVAEIDTKSERGQDPQALWQHEIKRQIEKLTTDLAQSPNTVEGSILRSELQPVLTRIRLKQLKSGSQPVLLSGSIAGNYHALARGIAKVSPSSTSEEMHIVSTSGAIENIELIHRRLATFALTQSDLAAASYAGSGIFTGQASSHIRALAALYPEPVQIVVRKNSSISTLSDLTGRRVNIGSDGTGTQANALQILNLAGIDSSEFSRMDVATGVSELTADRLDAIFITGALPSRYLRGVDNRVELLALEEGIIKRLVEQHGYINYQVKTGVYPGVAKAIATVAVTAVLVADERASDGQVTAVLKGLFDDSEPQSEYGGAMAGLDVNRALEGIAIPLHSAAADFFDEIVSKELN